MGSKKSNATLPSIKNESPSATKPQKKWPKSISSFKGATIKPFESFRDDLKDILNIDDLKKMLGDFADARDWNQYHSPKNLAMSLACESGELLEIFKWMTEAQSQEAKNNPKIKEEISHELADILTNLIRLAGLLDIHLHDALLKKMNINAQKYPVELVKGSCKKYTDY